MSGQLSYSVLLSEYANRDRAQKLTNRELGEALMEELRNSTTPLMVSLHEEESPFSGNYLPYPQTELRTYLVIRKVQYQHVVINIPEYKTTVVESWLLKFWNWLRGKKYVT